MLDRPYDIEEFSPELIWTEERLLGKQVIYRGNKRSSLIPAPANEPPLEVLERYRTLEEAVDPCPDLVINSRHKSHGTSFWLDGRGG